MGEIETQMKEIVEHGLYIIKDSYFQRFPNTTWSDNKGQRRPHYYAFRGSDGIFWMIPLSSQVETARRTIEKFESSHPGKKCLYCHIGQVAGRERSFNISSMFPVTEEYIDRPFDFFGSAYVVGVSGLNSEVLEKASTYLNMVKRGRLYNSKNIFAIRAQLLSESGEPDP